MLCRLLELMGVYCEFNNRMCDNKHCFVYKHRVYGYRIVCTRGARQSVLATIVNIWPS